MKKTLFLLPLLCLVFCLASPSVSATEQVDEYAGNYYEDQLQSSGAEDLPEELPEETQEILDNLGASSPDWKSMSSLTPGSFFTEVLRIAGNQSAGPMKAGLQVLGVLLLCALVDGMRLSFADRPLGGVLGMVGTLCVAVIVILPIVNCIESAATVIRGASTFMLAYIPVLAGIMIAGQQVATGTTYNLFLFGASEVIAQIANGFLIPLLNVFLGMSVVSSISPKLNLSGLCEMFHKVVKWILGLCMTIFVSLLTIQTLISSSADNATTRAAKFVVGSLPVVGNAVSEAFTTIQSCLKLLKSGVGAFGIIAAACIFLPILLQCTIWLGTLHLCAFAGDLFELSAISTLLRSAAKVMSVIIAILICCMMLLCVSTVVVLLIGGFGG